MKDASNDLSRRWSSSIALWATGLWLALLFVIYFFDLGRWTMVLNAFDLASATLQRLSFGHDFGWLMVGRLLDLGCVGVLVTSAALIGLGIMRVFRLGEEISFLRWLTAIAIGLLLIGDAVLGLGLVGIMTPALFWALLVAPAAAVLFWQKNWLRREVACWRFRSVIEGWGWFEAILFALLVAAAALNLIGAFTPEFEYDALEYHLSAPKEYLQAGRIAFLPHNFYASMPSLTEMLYLWAMTVRGDGPTKLLHWTFGILSALAAFAVGKKLFHSRVGLLAATIFYTVPVVTDLSMTARIDLATIFFCSVAVAQAVSFFAENQRSALWLAAVVTAAAFSTKYPAATIVVLPLAIVLLIVLGKENGLKPATRQVVLFLGLVLMVAAPWLLKNLVQTGNPVFPIFHRFFPSARWDAARDAIFVGFHSPKFSPDSLKSFLLSARGYFFLEPTATPLLLMLLPLAVLFRPWPRAARRECSSPQAARRDPDLLVGARAVRFLALWIVFAVMGWFFCSFRPWRFVLPIFPVAAVLAAVVVDCFSDEKILRGAFRGILLLVLIVQVSVTSLIILADVENPERLDPRTNCVTWFTGETSKERFLTATGFGTIVWMNQNLPPAATVLYVGEARAYHAKHRVLWNTVFDKSILGEMVGSAKTADDLWAAMRSKGITHIYWNRHEANRLADHYQYLKNMDWTLFQDFLTAHTTKVFELGRLFNGELWHEVYQVK